MATRGCLVRTRVLQQLARSCQPDGLGMQMLSGMWEMSQRHGGLISMVRALLYVTRLLVSWGGGAREELG